MGPGEHRPHDEEYWQRPWARALFAGDLFEAIPFGDQPTVIYTTEAADTPGKHFLGEVAFGYGLLITPTCDMAEQHSTGQVAHPYRVLVPVVPFDLVAEQTAAIGKSIGLLRSRDAITPYMYLPPLAGLFESEQVACLFRPTLVSDELLRDPPRRVAQLQAARTPAPEGQARGLLGPSSPQPRRSAAARARRSRDPRQHLATERLRLIERDRSRHRRGQARRGVALSHRQRC